MELHRSMSPQAQRTYVRLWHIAQLWWRLPGVRLTVSGQSHIPDYGPVVMVSNHPARMHTFVPLIVIGRNVATLAAAELWLILPIGWLLSRLGFIPVIRQCRSGRQRAYNRALAVLRTGGSVYLCPEGKHSESGVVSRFSLGAARMATATQCPVIPMGVRLHWDGWTRHVVVKVGTAIDPTQFDSAEELTEYVRKQVAYLACMLVE